MSNELIYVKNLKDSSKLFKQGDTIFGARINDTVIGDTAPNVGFFSYLKSSIVEFLGGSITNTRIDMHTKDLTGLKDPINATDAVNLQYLSDSIVTNNTQYGLVPVIIVYLSGTSKVLISDKLMGSFVINVYTENEGYPCSVFAITKNMKNTKIHGNKISNASGNLSNTALNIEWNNNDGIYLFKNNISYDGNYIVKIS